MTATDFHFHAANSAATARAGTRFCRTEES